MKTIIKQVLKFTPYVVFVLLAARIAFTRQFPLPFDESYHFGIINFYAHHLSPFFSRQPASADIYGALARDPSYIYQYLMSFPLRALLALHATLLQQVLVLRAIDISFGIGTLYLTGKLARQFGLSPKIGYLAALGLAVTPAFYDLSGQINYDTLLLPLTLLSFLLTMQVVGQIRAGRLQPRRLAALTSLALLTSLVMYSYLPILLAIALFVGFELWRHRSYRLVRNFVLDTRGLKRLTQLALVGLVLLSAGLWLQRYGVNIERYHTPHPQCNAVLSVSQCMGYSVWARNYDLHQAALGHLTPIGPANLKYFSHLWLGTMYKELFSLVTLNNASQPVWLLDKRALVIGSLLIGPAIVWAGVWVRRWRRLMARWSFASLAISLYLAILWIQNYSDFHNLGQLIGVQGRYLLPVLPLGYLAVAGLWRDGLLAAWRASERFSRDLLPVVMATGLRLRNELFMPRSLPLRILSAK